MEIELYLLFLQGGAYTLGKVTNNHFSLHSHIQSRLQGIITTVELQQSNSLELAHQRKHRIYLGPHNVFPMIWRPRGTNVRHIHKPAVHRYLFDMHQSFHPCIRRIKPSLEQSHRRISFCYTLFAKLSVPELLAKTSTRACSIHLIPILLHSRSFRGEMVGHSWGDR